MCKFSIDMKEVDKSVKSVEVCTVTYLSVLKLSIQLLYFSSTSISPRSGFWIHCFNIPNLECEEWKDVVKSCCVTHRYLTSNRSPSLQRLNFASRAGLASFTIWRLSAAYCLLRSLVCPHPSKGKISYELRYTDILYVDSLRSTKQN